ncbi:hypothetical protein [Cellulomonas sp. HZM]|uniref:hypothetical protein n=1 Tax=Cellulomonas sp. HZM TaxID=1454010 RepID=UPI0012DC26BE|nr:hypothetical protein [Cellulomonas sp. HZM]
MRHRPYPDADEMAVARRLPVTSLEVTAWDCLTTMRCLDALVVADAALRAGASLDELVERARRRQGRRGSTRARTILEHADAGAESPRETYLRLVLLRAGLPAPQTQVPARTGRGTYWGDLGWPRWRLLVEYDGRDKYRATDGTDLWREKLRRDALADAGWRTVHVTKEDRPSDIVRRVVTHIPVDARVALTVRRELMGW